MKHEIVPYALPAILALIAKAGLFFYARYSKIHNLQTRLYLSFLFCLSIQNLVEINLFSLRADGVVNPPGGTLYFGVGVAAIAFLLHLSLVMAVNWRDAKNNVPVLGLVLIYIPPIVLEILLWGTPLLVTGLQPMNYTYTKIPGPLYFLFEIYALSYLLVSAVLLIYGARTNVVPFKRLQSKLLLFGLLPFFVLVLTIICLQRFGFRGFNTTVTLPLAVTFFLLVTGYATHQYRLFDIEFFIPWSKVRKRKTAFYRRIQFLIAEISQMSSFQKIVQSISDALHCPVALIGGPTPSLAIAGEAFRIARFPLDQLRKIDQIVVSTEITDAMPQIHALMKRHKVAAIVPFHPHSQAAANWMLFGDAFSEHVYSPLDFKTVETLFARLADHFLDNQVLLRAQLHEAQREMDALRARLANAWEQIDVLRRKLDEKESENNPTQPRNLETLHRDLTTIQTDVLDHTSEKKRSLDQHVAEFEVRLIGKTLEHSGGEVGLAAELLGLPIEALQRKLEQIAKRGIDPEEPQVFFV